MEGEGSTTRTPEIPARLLTDVSNLLFAGMLLLLAVLFPQSVLKRSETIITCAAIAVVYAGVLVWLRSPRREPAAAMVYSVAVLLMTSYFFEIVGNMQHLLLTHWQDDHLLALEQRLLGEPFSLMLEGGISRPLTEWMMFSYVAYVPLLPLVALLCYRAGGKQAAEEYLLNLTLANIVCYLGFMVFPVAGPLGNVAFTVPLEGGFFTQCAEWIRHHAHYAGGSLPSPHCAAATVMAVMLYRYNRKVMYLILPVILTLYVSTVYGRFHYAADAVTGILTAALVLKYSPSLARILQTVRVQKLSRREPEMQLQPDVIPPETLDRPALPDRLSATD